MLSMDFSPLLVKSDVLPRTLMGGGVNMGPLDDWMGNLPSSLLKVPLNALAIPGSHDSFTNFLDKDGPISPSEPKELRDLAHVFGNLVKDIVYKWSVTQKFSPREQLGAGVRYFDIRVSTKAGSTDFYAVHGLYGLSIASNLNEINDFLVEHPKEVVILDFNHFYDMHQDDHLKLMQLIQTIFGAKLCPFIDTGSVCLDMLWENHLQVVARYTDSAAKHNMTFWPDTAISSPWPNVTDTTKLLDILEANYEKGRCPTQFHVTQGVLTPDVPFILSHMGASLERDLADKAAKPFIDWLRNKKCGLQKGINICILDFVQLHDYVSIVINLNFKSQPELTCTDTE